MSATHGVTNQPPPREEFDAWAADPWLRAAVARAGVAWIEPQAQALGRYVGSAEARAHAAAANRHLPELRTHDRFGHRIDTVDYHPSYHALMGRALGAGLHSLAWKRPDGGFSARAALFHLWNQLEQGTSCPVTMTFASIPLFEQAPALEAAWRERVLADAYDGRLAAPSRKGSAMIGMAMTEKQGGSDLREVITHAEPEGHHHWWLTGHKWFCSAPMSDGFFTLARADGAVTCFFVPRMLEDGTRNVFEIQRLKDKVGNRSNASCEVEFRDTMAWMVGEPGRGIATILTMAHHTRFDIVVALAGMMRAALDEAAHHARHRRAFGKRLAEHALMRNVLADLALEAEAATLLAFRLAAAFDGSRADERERELQRVLTPIAKYWLCKRMTPVATEAMECLGGNGYVEEGPLARLYREAPLNGIWEGSANVICLDALRAIGRSPGSLEVLEAEIAAGQVPGTAERLAQVRSLLSDAPRAEERARTIVETLAVSLQASLMARHADPVAASAFHASRLDRGGMANFGTLEADAAALGRILERGGL